MSERDHILTSLIKEVLGPRNGAYEVLPAVHDPRNEYITGVLAPVGLQHVERDIDNDIEEVVEGVEEGDEDENQATNIVISGSFSPALNPKELPHSIGISFTVESMDGSNPELEICTTWARYVAGENGWARQPAHFLTGPINASRENQWLCAEGVKINLKSRRVSSTRWRISVYLVNNTNLTQDRYETRHLLFQPQIRISCQPNTECVPTTVNGSDIQSQDINSVEFEEQSLEMLYRDRPAMARGHLCGALWKEIDPERESPTFTERPMEHPFYWVDSILLPETERHKFSPADIRSDMVPCYPVQISEMEWDTRYGIVPELNPDTLSEIYDPQELANNLAPLVSGYTAWIEEQVQRVDGFLGAQRSIAMVNIEKCREAVERIEAGIHILCEDEDSRLAFCFANKAIALQSLWSRNTIIRWRPFQLAFILLNIQALAQPGHTDREICDLLWFPTGGGKTEAYLGLTAFVLSLRRQRAYRTPEGSRTGAGTGVLSRYTLKLLTIQQYRRALGLITACEFLRVQNLNRPGTPAGWRPRDCNNTRHFLWGRIRFSIGLWLGTAVTPNKLNSTGPVLKPPPAHGLTFFAGALDILKGVSKDYIGPDTRLARICQQASIELTGEPAQIVDCPCCGSILAIPDKDYCPTRLTIHWMFRQQRFQPPIIQAIQPDRLPLTIENVDFHSMEAQGYHTMSLTCSLAEGESIAARDIDDWWYRIVKPALGLDAELLSARPSRPGYYILDYQNIQGNRQPYDFNIYCPNPECVLNSQAWAEQVPLNSNAQCATSARNGGAITQSFMATNTNPELPKAEDMQWEDIPEWLQRNDHPKIANRIPIPAYTVDDQIYSRCPSFVIATVDKFARLAYEPKASSLFGNVDHYHARWGYYREGCPPYVNGSQSFLPHPPGHSRNNPLHLPVPRFNTPDLIIQDELHLIEGPLGSMVGLYETAIDILCEQLSNDNVIRPKYIASSATVRQAGPQVQALFNRRLAQFPASGITADDRFFSRDCEIHPLDDTNPGRLYVAICAPGKGAQTPIVRIWSALLQAAWNRLQENPNAVNELDFFWTISGYFNAIRELAGASALYRQDILERMSFTSGTEARPLQQENSIELSSQSNSLQLPELLKRLEVGMRTDLSSVVDAVFATSMFGTGVDIDRLGLMVVHGQPKTTASYIQATGRVGRRRGGLVVSFFRASRPRDLDHYEFFTGYHRALYRYVEPITVAPFSPRARERGLGPLKVILLRQSNALRGIAVNSAWSIQQRISNGVFSNAGRMASNRNAPEVRIIPRILEERALAQPEGRCPPEGVTFNEAESNLDRWEDIARTTQNSSLNQLLYNESSAYRQPAMNVVLGDAQHRALRLGEVYRNAPQSLREVEETTGFRT